MKENFEQELLMDCLDQIVGMRKEHTMLVAKTRGVVGRVAKMIDQAVHQFKNKGLTVRYGHGDVRCWLATCEARVSNYSFDEVEVVLGVACSPFDLKGHTKLTKKEAEIVAELQKIWVHNLMCKYFFDREQFKELSDKLRVLTHHLECYNELSYYYGIDDFYRREDLLSKHYDLSGVTDNPDCHISTRDLVSISELYG